MSDPEINLKTNQESFHTNTHLFNQVPSPNARSTNTKLMKSKHGSIEEFLRDAKRSDGSFRRVRAADQSDIGAMSVLSMYGSANNLSEDMDTSDLAEMEPIPDPSSIPLADTTEEFDSIDLEKGFSNVSLWFDDGERSIDYVLVWEEKDDLKLEKQMEAAAQRACFEQNLVKEGLELESSDVKELGLHFIKIHAPREVSRRYSEILKLRMPMREIPGLQGVQSRTKSFWNKVGERLFVDKKNFPTKSHRFTALYSRDKEYLFDLDQPGFFPPSVKSRIVQFILDRKRFSTDREDDFAFGIERMISQEIYTAAYPLHDGDLHSPGSMRNLLYSEWASVKKCFRYQPLDYVKDYFGVKIGLYFAWLGFYTHMLLPAAVVGVGCFIYSWATLYQNVPSEDICNPDNSIDMCPVCDHWCGFWKLKQTCFHARVTYLFDNPTTVFFAIFMSFWATLFLELWKRYSAEITHRWDLTGFDVQEEHPRPQYLARLAHVERHRVNVVTNTMEPHVPFWRVKLPATILSFSIVLLLVALAGVAVLAVVLYRMSVLAALSVYGYSSTISSYAIIFTTATAATINLFLIVIFNWIYTYLAEVLTETELLRTQTEFDDSLTLKIYLLQFVNYYASIFYIAFFKGKLVGFPGHYNRLFDKYRQEECGTGGCLMELCIQLAIIMVGKQAMNTVLEMTMPIFYRWLNSLKARKGNLKAENISAQRWVKDYRLMEFGSRGLFPEYLEMVLQYGFVTIFVAAFPLAPFFALLNNILEMRLDAKKLLTFCRRPVTQRVRDIGVWYRILDSISKLSVITNGFIIAFTSNFIPKLVYRLEVSDENSLEGYLDHSLSKYNVSELLDGPINPENVTICRYSDYRAPPDAPDRYKLTAMYWHILAARLAFVVVFENIVAVVMILVRWCVPDMPHALRDQIRREAYITNEIIIKQEAARARDKSCHKPTERVTTAHWARLMDHTLSSSQLDLALHEHEHELGENNNSPLISPNGSLSRRQRRHHSLTQIGEKPSMS